MRAHKTAIAAAVVTLCAACGGGGDGGSSPSGAPPSASLVSPTSGDDSGADTSPTGSGTKPAKLLFWSGFESGVSIGAPRVVRGAANVAHGALAFSRLDIEVRPALVNGAVGTVTFRDGRPFAIAGFTIRNRRIVEMDIIADPERLNRLDLEVLD